MESENQNIQRYKWTPSGMVLASDGIWKTNGAYLKLLLDKAKLDQENTILMLRLRKYEKQYGKLK